MSLQKQTPLDSAQPAQGIEQVICVRVSFGSFGEYLFDARKRAGINQIQAATKCRVSRRAFNTIENSRRPPPPGSTCERIAIGLELTEAQAQQLAAIAAAERILWSVRKEMMAIPVHMQSHVRELLGGLPM